MEPDSRLSGLSEDERLEVYVLLLEEWQAREPEMGADHRPGNARTGRRMLLNILRKLGPTTEMIRELADELHVDVAPILDRVGHVERDE